MRIIARSALGSCLFLVFISFWTVFFRLGALPLSGADEPRYARIAQEMQAEGQWVTPILEGKPWLEKPPLYYWTTIPFYSVFGISETTARLGPAMLVLLTSLVVLWLGRQLWTPLAGLLGATILLTSLGIVGYGRSASMDVPLTAFLTIALAALAVAAVRQDFPTWKVRLGWASLGLAMLAKGPVAPVLVAGIGILFWCLDGRGGILRRWRPVTGFAIAAAVSLPWYWLAFRQNGFSFVAVFFINHNLARYVSDLHHHSEPAYYFLPVMLGMLFPWSGWLLLLAPDAPLNRVRNWREWRPATLFMICWIIFPLLFFSFSFSKLAGYVLPIMPPLALLLGARFAEWCESPGSAGKPGVAWLYLALTAGAAAASPLAFGQTFDGHWEIGLWIGVAILVPACFGFLFGRRGKWEKTFIATGLQGSLLVVTLALLAFPALGDHYSTRGIARETLRLREPAESIVTYRFFHHTLNYYTGYQIAAELQDPATLRDFLANHPEALVVTEAGRIPEIQSIKGVSATVLHSQSKFRLLRLQYKAGSP